MTEPALPAHVFKRFIQILCAHVCMDVFGAVFDKADLPADWMDPKRMPDRDEASAVQAYAQLQDAVRVSYGRGARVFIARWRYDVEAGFERCASYR